MVTFLRRFCKMRPVVATVFAILLLAEIGIGTVMAFGGLRKIGTGYEVEGIWTSSDNGTSCTFIHRPDRWNTDVNGGTVVAFPKGHWSTCTRQKVGNEVCVDFAQPAGGCVGSSPDGKPDQDHYDEK